MTSAQPDMAAPLPPAADRPPGANATDAGAAPLRLEDPEALTGRPGVPAAMPESQVHPHADLPPLANPSFRVFLAGEGISAVGDAITFTALPLLVLALTGSGLMMGVLGALQMLPDLVIGMVAGVIADRADRRRIMIAANLGRAALAGLIPLSVLLDGPTLAVVLLVAAPISVLRSFFLAAYTAAIPSIVGRPNVAAATSYLEVVYSLGYIAGPAAAGILVAVIGPGLTITIDAASFLLSAAAVALVAANLKAPPVPHRLDIPGEIRVGVEYIRSHGTLRSAIVVWGLFCVISAGSFNALTYRVTVDLGRSTAELGVLLSVFGVGTVGSAIFMSRMRTGGARWLLLGGIACQATALVLAGLVTANEALAVLTLLAGFGGSVILVSYLTVRTAYSPDELLGRIGATARVLSLGMQPVGMLAAGALLDAFDGGVTLVVMGGLLLVLALAALPSRSLRAAQLNPARPTA